MTRKYRSRFNGILEVNEVNGEKVLDGKSANYSYGNLKIVWDKGLHKIGIENVERVLVLGMGGGSVIELLREKYNFNGKIVAIEIDPVIIEIAAHEFGITNDKSLRIECIDAAEYVTKRTSRFDLILVDLFIDDKIPGKLLSVEFWQLLAGKAAIHCKILFNAFEDTGKLEGVKSALLNAGFTIKIFKNVNGANLMIFAVR
ncbi:hypothetical protein BH11BAC2_BH11BAC2_26040 [soil metagenome]